MLRCEVDARSSTEFRVRQITGSIWDFRIGSLSNFRTRSALFRVFRVFGVFIFGTLKPFGKWKLFCRDGSRLHLPKQCRMVIPVEFEGALISPVGSGTLMIRFLFDDPADLLAAAKPGYSTEGPYIAIDHIVHLIPSQVRDILILLFRQL